MKLAGIKSVLASMMTFKEVCEMMDKSERSVRYYIADRGLPVVKVGLTLHFDRPAVLEWLKSRETGPKGRFKDLGGDDNAEET